MKKKYTVILTIIFMVLAGAFELFQGTVAITPGEELKVHFLDVGQGGRIYQRSPCYRCRDDGDRRDGSRQGQQESCKSHAEDRT